MLAEMGFGKESLRTNYLRHDCLGLFCFVVTGLFGWVGLHAEGYFATFPGKYLLTLVETYIINR
jgi:hypothetical protein